MFMCWISSYARAHGLLRSRKRRYVAADTQPALAAPRRRTQAPVRASSSCRSSRGRIPPPPWRSTAARASASVSTSTFGRPLEGSGPVHDAGIGDARPERFPGFPWAHALDFFRLRGHVAHARYARREQAAGRRRAAGDCACPTGPATGRVPPHRSAADPDGISSEPSAPTARIVLPSTSTVVAGRHAVPIRRRKIRACSMTSGPAGFRLRRSGLRAARAFEPAPPAPRAASAPRRLPALGHERDTSHRRSRTSRPYHRARCRMAGSRGRKSRPAGRGAIRRRTFTVRSSS